MENCGGGGQRLPPDGDEFPAAYHEFTTSSSQQYQPYVTKPTDQPDTTSTSFHPSEKTIHVVKSLAETRFQDSVVVGSYSLYNSQKTIPTHVMEKSIEIAAYYPKDSNEDSNASPPPPLPLTGPPASNKSDHWRQDNKSEKSVKDKIAMFSSQSSLEAPLFPTPIVPTSRRLSKHKSSDDVFGEDKPQPAERAQSSFELNKNQPAITKTNGSVYTSSNKSFDATTASSPPKNTLIRATSFSGSSPLAVDRLQTSSELLSGTTPSIARTNSLASTFKRPSDDVRKSSLSQLIEQRRKGISKLRGLVIPERDALPVDQPIIDLPEIKSRDSILINQVPRSNIQDKWGSQSSLASNASTVSSSVRASSGTFKMPAPKILSSYSPAFKRKSLTVYGNSQQTNGNAMSNGSSSSKNSSQLTSPASEAPKSLESICSPTRSDYSFDFVSSSGGGSPENHLPKPKLNSSNNRKIGRNEYDDSDNDSAVSSSQSSISRGFSPPMSPVPSDRSTLSSSERSYLSSEPHYQPPRGQLILTDRSNGLTTPEKTGYRSTFERSFSTPDKKQVYQQSVTTDRCITQIPQRQLLKRSSSTETNSSCSGSSTLTSGGSSHSSDSLSRRVLKPQSVEAINRKNILASARCRSGRDLNGSPLIQRKFNDEEEQIAAGQQENGGSGFVNAHRMTNGATDCTKPQIKIAYIEITENVVAEEKFDKELEQQQPQPRLPPKRSIIPQAKNVPIPTSRPPKPEPLEPSNDMKSWVRAELRSLSNNYSNKSDTLPSQTLSNGAQRNFMSKSSLTLNEQSPTTATVLTAEADLIEAVRPKSRSTLGLKKSAEEQSDLLTVLTTRSRSRSAIHVEETSYGKLKSQMSLEDILAVKAETGNSKLPRSQSVSSEKNGIISGPFASPSRAIERPVVRRSSSTDSWSEEKIFPSRIPALSKSNGKLEDQPIDSCENGGKQQTVNSKIPMPRNLGRRSASVTDMKRVFEKQTELSQSSSGTSSPGGQLNSTSAHNRFPSLDSSSAEDSIRPVMTAGCEATDQERFSGEQFGSISSLASSTSLISQQELAQLVEEANLEEPRGGHDVVVVLLHKENPSGSVGITLAGGVDCETKEITIHRVLAHSIADRDGSVQRGDRILSINGRSMRGLSHRESLAVLKQPRSEVVLVVSRAKLDETGGARLRSHTESVETIVEGYETNGVAENTAWGPPLMVAMYKDGAGLGFSLEGGRDSPLGDRPLLIKKIFTGGAAEKTGALRAGDQLLEVNKRDVSRMSRIEAWSLMKKLPDGEVNLLVRHPATKSSS